MSKQSTVVAFYSSSDGAGRSCMAANIALILASQGQRVLVVDHDLASPSLHRYLSAFLPAARTGPWSDTPVRLEGDFGHPHGTIDFLGPATDSPAPAPGSPSPAPASPGTCAVRRPDLVTMDYDVVLIDTPAGVGAAPIAEQLADIVVLGFTLSQQHRNRAVQLAREIENGSRGNAIRILPVPMRVDQAAGQATAQRRIAAHRQFAWLVEDLTDAERQRYWADVEIPYEPDYADEEGLPFLDQPSVHRERLVGAHLMLARRLLPGMPEMTLPPAPDPALRRYREAREDAARRNNTVTILHAAADRYWAEWIAAALRSMEFTAARRWIDRVRAEDLPPGPTLIVVSARLLGLPGLEDRLRRVIARAQADSQVPGAVTIDGTWLPDELFPRLGKVSLLGKNAKEAHEELASYYQVPGSIAPSANQLYFPGRRESFGVNLPTFISSPAGRDDIIDRIRDHFTARETPPPLTLTGPAGMGKTQIALEYAARFRSYYDTIALIRADSAEAVQTGLGELAAQKPPKHPAGDPRAAVLEELRSGPAERWLLIYSGADQPAVLDGLIPEASEGHVLVTAREAVRDGSVPLAVPRLAPADATAVVSGLVEGILPEDADWVAEAMRGIPLALRLACAWLRVTAGELARDALPATITRDAVLELKSRYSSEPGQADPVGFTARLHLGDLPRGHLGRAATLLLQTCAFLGSSGLPWRILRSPEMRERLARENPEMSDPIMLSSALHELAKRGLLLLDDADLLPGDITRAPLRIHPSVLDVVRDGLTAEQRSQSRARTATLLATSVTPGIIDDVVEGEEVYAELLEHVGPSGAAAQTDDTVRLWLVNQVRFLWQSDSHGSWNAAVRLGESLREHWLAAMPGDAEARRDDPIMLRLTTQLANVYRSLDRLSDARELDEDTLVRERRVLGLDHPRTLMTARSYGADLRLVGDFEEALLTDSATWQLADQTMGRDHLLTITASGNLALSELLAGEPEHALQRRRDHDLPWCERFEKQRPEESAWVLGHIGILQRELGRYPEALASLRDAKQAFERSAPGGTTAPSSLMALLVESGIAIVERRLGRPQPDMNWRILEECQAAFGETSPLMWAILLSLAGDLAETGQPGEAVRKAQQALRGHSSFFGPNHPFTWISQVDLGNYALAAGQLSLAHEMSRSAHASLESSLGPRHLWTLAAAVARANVLAVTGHPDDAAALEEPVLGEYRKRLGTGNPLTRAVMENDRHTRRLRNEPGSVADPAGEAARRRSIELDIPPY